MTSLLDFSAGFSGERLARIPRFLEAQVVAGALPGALTLIWRRGRVAHQSLVGSIDLARGTAMREDAIFRLYSMTKPVTTVALLMLLEDGKIALADAVAKFIPGFANLPNGWCRWRRFRSCPSPAPAWRPVRHGCARPAMPATARRHR